MRVGFPGGPRLEWYDRNPLTRSVGYVGDGIAPHTPTDRASYTVPTGKKAFLETAFTYVRRDTVAAPVGRTLSMVNVTPSGGTYKPYIYAEMTNNTVGALDKTVVGESGVLGPGDYIVLTTADYSTGGTMGYRIVVKTTEFDA